ncbi:prevent-host-death protein [Saccharomonospora piscinae]|uniref:prevent-host-death protein n=1 Tax=Saccharomonospora piscinae TaxID=687388 RepID=UPI0012DED534|nr:prevent-host-death protein [Saccharomonospora piscinae]
MTTDLDTVDRRTARQTKQLELLVAAGARPSGPAGALIRTDWGEVQVDVLEITDADVDDLPIDPTDRLHVQSHAWAASTASELVLDAEELQPLPVRVAEPGPIIAMKLQSVMNRGSAKEGTDLLDIVRLTLDPTCGPRSRDQLESADAQLRADALLHAQRWFIRDKSRSLRKIRAVPEGREVEADDVSLVADLLSAALG